MIRNGIYDVDNSEQSWNKKNLVSTVKFNDMLVKVVTIGTLNTKDPKIL